MKHRVFLYMALMTLLLVQSCATPRFQVPKTGETTSYATGDHGAKEARTILPGQRFTDNNNGTVTDNSTGLIWLKNANCTDTVGGITKNGGRLTWADALTWSKSLASGDCGLSDGSTAGQWRVPKDMELKSLINLKDYDNATYMNTIGFANIQEWCYWSFNTNTLLKVAYAHQPFEWYPFILPGYKNNCDMTGSYYVWTVRNGH